MYRQVGVFGGGKENVTGVGYIGTLSMRAGSQALTSSENVHLVL